VKFSDEELLKLFRLARQRNDPKQRKWKSQGWNRNKSALAGHYDGIMAEMAVAKLLGVEINEEIYEGGDDGSDLVLPDGRTIQVKHRGQRDWDYALNSADLDDFITDIGVLCQPTPEYDDDAVDVVGYITKEQFAERAFRTNFLKKPNGWRLAVQQKDMEPIEALLGVLV